MDWKEENPRKRYIDDITEEECLLIAKLAVGEEDVTITSIKKECNGNNIPHIEIHIKYLDTCIFEDIETYIGIFHNLNIYQGKHFNTVYCQYEIFKEFNKMNFHNE